MSSQELRIKAKEVMARRGHETDFCVLRDYFAQQYQKALEFIPETQSGADTETAKGLARGMKLAQDIFNGNP